VSEDCHEVGVKKQAPDWAIDRITCDIRQLRITNAGPNVPLALISGELILRNASWTCQTLAERGTAYARR
jgi:hypothetical protein